MLVHGYSTGDSVLSEIRNIFEKDVLGDVSIVCEDGKVKKNKLLAGLIFPHLKYCEVFENNTEHVIIASDHCVEDIIQIMARKLEIGKKYTLALGTIATKKKRGRPIGSLGKNKKMKGDDDKSFPVDVQELKKKKSSTNSENGGSYEYNPAVLNILKSQLENQKDQREVEVTTPEDVIMEVTEEDIEDASVEEDIVCLLYTSPSPRDGLLSRMPSSA